MIEVLKRVLLVTLATPFFVVGCASHSDYSLTLDSERIKGYGFNISLPQEPGWRVITETNKSIYLAKFIENTDESYAILIDVIDSVSLGAIDGNDDKEKLENFSEKVYLREFSTKRYKSVTYERKINMPTNDNCARSYAKVIDLEAIKKSLNPDPMYMDIFELVCIHPYIPDTLLRIGYSYRHYPQKTNNTAVFKEIVFDFTDNILWEKPTKASTSHSASNKRIEIPFMRLSIVEPPKDWQIQKREGKKIPVWESKATGNTFSINLYDFDMDEDFINDTNDISKWINAVLCIVPTGLICKITDSKKVYINNKRFYRFDLSFGTRNKRIYFHLLPGYFYIFSIEGEKNYSLANRILQSVNFLD